jgi:DNA-directed RNA polymerase specialized sigma24 family protein
MAGGDRKLAQQALSGDARAGEALAARLRPDLLNLFLWLTRDPDLSESLTQEAFARIWERLGQFRGESSLRSWAHAVARLTLAEALGKLPDAERRVVVLCKLQGFTLAEAANILGEPVGTLAWRISEGMKTLRGLLADEPCAPPRPRSHLTQEVRPDVSEGS